MSKPLESLTAARPRKLSLERSTAFLRGEFVPFADANVSIASSPVLYGLSVYTVFSANWNAKHQQLYCFRLKEHYARLVQSARILGFASFERQYSFEEFQEIMLELLKTNNVKEDALVRATIFIDELAAGTRIEGLKTTLSVYVYPMGEILSLAGIHAMISSWRRVGDNMIPARAKVNGSYVNASLMKNEALLNGYDDAIALDVNDHVAEGTVANLFIVRDGVLITPLSSQDILEGITRRSILALAKELGVVTQERTVDRTELYIADEVFMVGSSAKVTPVLSVDRRRVGNGRPGTITRKLAREYHAVQHAETETRESWRTPVYSRS